MKAINLAYELLSDPARWRAASAPDRLSIVTSALPAARAGEPYRAQLAATGGAAPFTWEAVLPAGLALEASGAISGRVERTGSSRSRSRSRTGTDARRSACSSCTSSRRRCGCWPRRCRTPPSASRTRRSCGSRAASRRCGGRASPPPACNWATDCCSGRRWGPARRCRSTCACAILRGRPPRRPCRWSCGRPRRPATRAEWTPARLADEQHAQAVAAREAGVDVAAAPARIAMLRAAPRAPSARPRRDRRGGPRRGRRRGPAVAGRGGGRDRDRRGGAGVRDRGRAARPRPPGRARAAPPAPGLRPRRLPPLFGRAVRS